MVFILAGQQWVRCLGQEIVAVEGDLLMFPAGAAHTEWADGPLESAFWGVEWPDGPADAPLRVHDAYGRIRILVRWLLQEKFNHTPLSSLQIDSLHRSLLLEWLRLWRHRDDGLVASTRRFIRDHLTEPITLDDLAGRAGLSKFHFVRRYKDLAGRTPMADVRMIRLETARDLILTTQMPLKAIAPRVGLISEYHLCRLFRRHFDITPGGLRSGGLPPAPPHG